MPMQSLFGFLQVVNPQVCADLMEAKLDPSSAGELASALGRQSLYSPCHSSVFASMNCCWQSCRACEDSACLPAVSRDDPGHWSTVLRLMALTQEMEEQLIVVMQYWQQQVQGAWCEWRGGGGVGS